MGSNTSWGPAPVCTGGRRRRRRMRERRRRRRWRKSIASVKGDRPA